MRDAALPAAGVAIRWVAVAVRASGGLRRDTYDHILQHLGEPMATTERVTVTLPIDLVAAIDRLERNRSRFITEAVEHEIVRRRREGMLRSLASPHPEAAELAETGLADWGASLPADDDGLVDESAGTPVRWVEGQGWVEESAA